MKFRLVEENELDKRAKKHRKKQKGMSPFYSPDGGNVPLNISRFNNSTAEGANGLCENLDEDIWDSMNIYMGGTLESVDSFNRWMNNVIENCEELDSGR